MTYPLGGVLHRSNEEILEQGKENWGNRKEGRYSYGDRNAYENAELLETVELRVRKDQFRNRWQAEGWTTNGYRIEKRINGKCRRVQTSREDGGDLIVTYRLAFISPVEA